MSISRIFLFQMASYLCVFLNYYLGENSKMKLFIVIVDENVAVFGHERDELC